MSIIKSLKLIYSVLIYLTTSGLVLSSVRWGEAICLNIRTREREACHRVSVCYVELFEFDSFHFIFSS